MSNSTQNDWEAKDKIRLLLENLIVDIGVQVTDDYKRKNGLYEGMSIKNVRSRDKYIKLFVELLADARREVIAEIEKMIDQKYPYGYFADETDNPEEMLAVRGVREEKHIRRLDERDKQFISFLEYVLATLRKEEGTNG